VKTTRLEVDLATTPQTRKFRDELRTWLAANLTDQHRVRGLQDPSGASGEDFERRRTWQRVLNSGNWAGVHWPAQHGGRGATLREYAIYLLECATAGAPDPVNVIGLGMVGPTLIHHGTPDQQKHLAGIMSAESIWCQLFSETDAGSDLGAIRTKATPCPGGGWTVSGQKTWTSWGLQADYGLLLARTGRPGFAGLSAFIVPMAGHGVAVRVIRQMSGDTHFCEVFLDDARLGDDALVGELDEGWSVASSTLLHERTTAILPRYPSMLNAIDSLLELARADGVSPAHRDQAVSLWAQVQALTLAGYRGIALAEQGDPTPAASLLQRLRWGLLNQRIFELGAELEYMAGTGESTFSHLMLVSRGWTIGGGTSEIQRNMLAEKVLGLPKEPKTR
jgi:alkylation response protein AidB-like acyl-CoA dehydrogenase